MSYNFPPQFVFVYGTLKRSYGNHRILSAGGANYIDDAVSTDHTYQMVSNGSFPQIQDRYEEAHCNHAIYGELYLVNDLMTFKSLDRLESNGTLYLREKREFLCQKYQETIDAWIYLYIYGDMSVESYRDDAADVVCRQSLVHSGKTMVEWNRTRRFSWESLQQ